MTRRVASLRWRLLAATLAAMAVALTLAGVLLQSLFREHVMRQTEADLLRQLDLLTARLVVDAADQPRVDAAALADPRWQQPYSGLYWQVDRQSPVPAQGVLRSRSLWEDTLALPMDEPVRGEVHRHTLAGPQDSELRVLERTVRVGQSDSAWRLGVAVDLAETGAAVARFRGQLVLSLAVLLVLLGLAAWAQVAVGLRPLRDLRAALAALREGRAHRLPSGLPAEVQPLVDDFNRVLARQEDHLSRARTQAGNLAHALKTPLAVLDQLATQAEPPADWRHHVREQVALARRHVDWQLAQARASAAGQRRGHRTEVAPTGNALLRVMDKVHAQRHLDLGAHWPREPLVFAGEEPDLQELLGNLLDNACQWAQSSVALIGQRLPNDRLVLCVDDDGPGIAPEAREQALARGGRLDERKPGSGLGLAIAQDLARRYEGTLTLEDSPLGGLRVRVELPAAPDLA